MRELPQADHADLGLIPDSDHTEDMRKAPVAPEALRSEHHVGHHNHEQEL